MGSKSKSVVVGHNYFWGIHAIPCAAPIDGIVEFSVDEREAWRGFVSHGNVTVNSLTLFGGNEREGGVGGYIDVESGTYDWANQTAREPNEYLKQVLANGAYNPALATSYSQTATNPGLVSAFEGFFQLVFRKFYWGNLPRQKGWRVVLKNIFSTQPDRDTNGDPVAWRPDVAPVCPEYRIDDVNIHVALDNSGSMQTNSFSPFSPGRHLELRAAVKQAIDVWAAQADLGASIALRMVAWGQTEQTSFERIPFTSADTAAAKAWVDGYAVTADFTYFDKGVESAGQFFSDANAALLGANQLNNFTTAAVGDTSRIEDRNIVPGRRNVVLFVSDGFATQFDTVVQAKAHLDAIAGVEVYGVGITSVGDIPYIDNTGTVPVSDGTSASMTSFLTGPWMSRGDLNAAHILRHILIGTNAGGDGDYTKIGPSFDTAADLFFSECMGFCFYWDKNRMTRLEFRKHVEAHAGCRVYQDRTTGLWEINTIRPIATPGALPQITKDEIVEWIDHKYPRQHELPNQITVIGTRRDNGKPFAISRTNTAAVQSVTPPKVRNQQITFDGVTNPQLLEHICNRELAARTVPLRTGQIRLAYLPADMNEGDGFVLTDARLGISSVVCRVEEIDDTDGEDNSVIIRFTQDFYTTDPLANTTTGVGGDNPTTGTLNQTPVNATVFFHEERSYYDLTILRGQTQVDSDLVADDGLGTWHATANRPNAAHTGSDIAEEVSASVWNLVLSAPLMPTWTLDATLTRAADDSIFTCDMTGREYELAQNSMIQIGTERMRVDSVTLNAPAGKAIFVVGRGCLDTVPQEHAAGAAVMGWQFFANSDETHYTHGETVKHRILPKTSLGALPIGSGTDLNLTFASRAIRPYPVGALQVEGTYLPVDELSGTVTVDWAHRNRLTQTSVVVQDHTDASITPETGIRLDLIERIIDDVDAITYTRTTAISNPETTLSTTANLTTLAAQADSSTRFAEIGVKCYRGSSPEYENWQTPFVKFPFSPNASPSPSGIPIDPFFANVAVLLRFNGNDGSFQLPPNEGWSGLEALQRNTQPQGVKTSVSQALHYNTAADFTNSLQGLIMTDPAFSPTEWAQDLGIQDQFGSQTIEGWFYVNDLSNSPYNPTVFMATVDMSSSAGVHTVDDWGFAIYGRHDGTLGMLISTGTGQVRILDIESTPGVLPENQWFHLAAVRSGTRNWELFVNGSSVLTGTQAGEMKAQAVIGGTTYDVLTHFFIGGAGQIGATPDELQINGYVDSIRWTVGVPRYVTNFTPKEFYSNEALPSPSPSPSPLPNQGAIGHVVLTQSTTLAVSPSPGTMIWDTASNHVGSVWAASPNPERITAPTGAAFVMLAARVPIAMQGSSPGDDLTIILKKNGTELTRNVDANPGEGSAVIAGVWACVAGDYFEVEVGSVNVNPVEGASLFAATFY